MRRGVALAAAATAAALLSGGPAPAAFPGANGKIAFYSSGIGGPEIMVTTPGGDSHGFTPPAMGYFPSFSPNGRKIAFQSTGGIESQVVVMRANGTGRHPITPQEVSSFDPAFGPGLIAFWRSVGPQEDIFVVRPNGTHERRLTRSARNESAPAWSPNGKKLVFSAATADGRDLFVVDVETKRTRRLTRTEPVEENEPNWSPDGRRIVYTRYLKGTYDIGVMRADGSHRRLLTDDSLFDAYPAFSPNGEKIAFSRAILGEYEDIWVMDANGHHPHPIVENAGQDVGPDWGVKP